MFDSITGLTCVFQEILRDSPKQSSGGFLQKPPWVFLEFCKIKGKTLVPEFLFQLSCRPSKKNF